MRNESSSGANLAIQDAFAVLSGMGAIFIVGLPIYGVLHNTFPIAVEPGRKAVQLALFAVSVTLILAMWIWMVIDCAVGMAKGRGSSLIGWLVALVLLLPATWAYYFIEHRPRGRE